MSSNALLTSLLLIVFITGCTSYYTADDFASVPKADTHIHLNAESPAFAEQAEKDNFQILTINVDVPTYPPLDEQHRLSLIQQQHNPKRIHYLSAFSLQHWDSATWTKETLTKLEKDFKEGALGIKLWKNIGMTYKDSTGQFIMINNPRFDSVINYVIGENKTVMGHLGEPKNCWLPLDSMTVNNDRNYFKEHPQYHMYLHPDYPSYEDQINARDQFIERHPDMRFVGAHLGSLEWDVNELAKRLDKFPNMAVDMAARIGHLQYQAKKDREKVRNFFIKYQDRLIYATDDGISPDENGEEAAKGLHNRWVADWKFFVTDETLTVKEVNGSFQGLKLPKEVVDKIYYANAVKWFNIPVK